MSELTPKQVVAALDKYIVGQGAAKMAVDVAIRNREYEPDSNITIRRLAGTRRILVAAPAYLSKHGVPREIDDLHRHKLLWLRAQERREALEELDLRVAQLEHRLSLLEGTSPSS